MLHFSIEIGSDYILLRISNNYSQSEGRAPTEPGLHFGAILHVISFNKVSFDLYPVASGYVRYTCLAEGDIRIETLG